MIDFIYDISSDYSYDHIIRKHMIW